MLVEHVTAVFHFTLAVSALLWRCNPFHGEERSTFARRIIRTTMLAVSSYFEENPLCGAPRFRIDGSFNRSHILRTASGEAGVKPSSLSL